MGNAKNTRFVHGAAKMRAVLLDLLLAGAVLAVLLFLHPWLDFLELRTVDWRMRWKPASSVSDELVCIDIDDTSIEDLGRWPWDRRHLANMMMLLGREGARAVVLDGMIASRTDADNDEALVDAVRNAGNCLSGVAMALDREGKKVEGERPSAPPALLLSLSRFTLGLSEEVGIRPYSVERVVPLLEGIPDFSAGMGHITCVPDRDGVNRRLPLVVDLGGAAFPSLALATAKDVLRADEVMLEEGQIVLKGPSSQTVIPVDDRGALTINFAGPWGGSLPHYAFSGLMRALENKEHATEALPNLEGKTCIICAAFSGGTDMGATPMQNDTPLAGLLVSAINTIVTGQFLREAGFATRAGLMAGAMLVALVAAQASRPAWLVAGMLLMLLIFPFLGLTAFYSSGFVLPIVEPVAAVLGASAVLGTRRLTQTHRERARLRNALGRYMPDEAVAELMHHPLLLEARSERKEVSILAVKMANYTELVVGADPEDVVALLSGYYDRVAEAVHENGGTVERFQEDVAIAYFGHPFYSEDHPARAVRTGGSLLGNIAPMSESGRFQRKYIILKCGVVTGFATVGDFGKPPEVRYGIVGERVALAECLAEEADPGEMVAAETTVARLAQQEDWLQRGAIAFRETAHPVFSAKTGQDAADSGYMASTVTARVATEKRGPFRVVAKVGQGGMASVYKGYDEKLDRFVAIKEPLERGMGDPDFIARFLREAKVLARMNHPRVVQIFHVDEHRGKPFIVMEYVDGESLQGLVKREGKLSPVYAARLILESADGLAAAQERNVIHRDVKPGNILLSKQGEVKVVDFGLSRTLDPMDTAQSANKISGTPLYISPEQVRCDELDFRTDIYSLGCTLFHLIAGVTPFTGKGTHELLTKHMQEPAPPLASVCPEVPASLSNTVKKMLEKDRERRHASYRELIEELQREIDSLEGAETVLDVTGGPSDEN